MESVAADAGDASFRDEAPSRGTRPLPGEASCAVVGCDCDGEDSGGGQERTEDGCDPRSVDRRAPRRTAVPLDRDVDEEAMHAGLLSDRDDGDGLEPSTDAASHEAQRVDRRLPPDGRPTTDNERNALLRRLVRSLYGDALTLEQMLRTLALAVTLLMIVGAYWLLRSLKDPVIISLCGYGVIPKAQMLTPFVVFGVVAGYNRLLDLPYLHKHQLFYVFGILYSVLFGLISLLLMHPTVGLPNQQQDPTRILGWLHYFAIESFGSVMTALFWSFANATVNVETAKAGYGVMVATAQIGSILGATFVQQSVTWIGVAGCYLVGSVAVLLTPVSVFLYTRFYGNDIRHNPTSAAAAKKTKPKCCEGARVFVAYSYVRGILVISSLFIIELAIVDYTMKRLAVEHFSSLYPCESTMTCWESDSEVQHNMSKDATQAMTSFMGTFGQVTNTLTFVMSLFGTSIVLRTIGLRPTLLLFPTLCLVVVCIILTQPTLWILFGAMILLKAFTYALNNPTKEILYQPTHTSTIRYKAKSWIDMFGARGSKACAGLITNLLNGSMRELIVYGSSVGIGVSLFLIYNAYDMGKKFEEYTASGYIVGGDDDTVDINEEDSSLDDDDEEQSPGSMQMAPLVADSSRQIS